MTSSSECHVYLLNFLYKTEVKNRFTDCLVLVYLSRLSLYALISGGAKRSRTVDLLRARQALYQLSYGP